jgi:hypothetical protein
MTASIFSSLSGMMTNPMITITHKHSPQEITTAKVLILFGLLSFIG